VAKAPKKRMRRKCPTSPTTKSDVKEIMLPCLSDHITGNHVDHTGSFFNYMQLGGSHVLQPELVLTGGSSSSSCPFVPPRNHVIEVSDESQESVIITSVTFAPEN
jgi:hypothetical protein